MDNLITKFLHQTWSAEPIRRCSRPAKTFTATDTGSLKLETFLAVQLMMTRWRICLLHHGLMQNCLGHDALAAVQREILFLHRTRGDIEFDQSTSFLRLNQLRPITLGFVFFPKFPRHKVVCILCSTWRQGHPMSCDALRACRTLKGYQSDITPFITLLN